MALSRWGAGLMDAPREDEDLRARWAAVAMRAALGGGDARWGFRELRIDGEASHLRVGNGGEAEEARQGSARDTHLVVTGDAETFLRRGRGAYGPRRSRRIWGTKDRG